MPSTYGKQSQGARARKPRLDRVGKSTKVHPSTKGNADASGRRKMSLATGKAKRAMPNGTNVAVHSCARSEGRPRQTACRPGRRLKRCKLTMESASRRLVYAGG